MKNNEDEQSKIYDLKAREEERIGFESRRDKLGFRYCRTLKDLNFFKLLSSLEIKKNDKILDLGCYTGHILNRINTEFKTQGFGVDISKNSINQASKYKGFNNKYFVSSGNKIPFSDNFFDGVFSLDVLEHVENKNLFLKEFFRVLKPNGWFLIYAVSANYKFTINWLLWKIKNSKNEYGFWKEAGHTEELLVNPKEMFSIIKNFASEKKILYFHSFFTLIFDLYFSRIFNKIIHSLIRKRKSLGFLLKLYLFKYNFFLFLLTFLDKFWTKRGLSNGFFLLGRKKIN